MVVSEWFFGEKGWECTECTAFWLGGPKPKHSHPCREHHWHITREARMINPPWPYRWCCRCGQVVDAERKPVLEESPARHFYLTDCGKWREAERGGIACVE